MSIDPNIVAPYRLEWRPYGNSRWQLIDCLDEHPEDRLPGVIAKNYRHIGSGQWRIVSQHVCYVLNWPS